MNDDELRGAFAGLVRAVTACVYVGLALGAASGAVALVLGASDRTLAAFIGSLVFVAVMTLPFCWNYARTGRFKG